MDQIPIKDQALSPKLQTAEKLAPGGDGERAGAVGAVHAPGLALAIGRLAVVEQGLAEGEEFFHAFVAALEQAFAGFVPLDDGARPAAEAGISAARGAGVYVDRAFAGGVVVELEDVAIVAAPGVADLQEVGPDVLGFEVFDWVGNPDALEVGMAAQAVAGFAIGHGLRAGGAFAAARAEMEDGVAPLADALFHKLGDGINLQALGAPAEGAVWRRIAAADDIHPEGLLGRGVAGGGLRY
jgi:hypothetical protein